jgi:hypothetical protein
MNIFKFKSSATLEDKVCPVCNGPSESIQHIFFDCILAKAIWRSSRWPMDLSLFAGLPIASWIHAFLHPNSDLGIPNAETEDFQLSMMIAIDAIWCARNNRVHNNVIIHFPSILIQIQNSTQIHRKAWSDKDLLVSWSPPSLGILKVNFDVAVRPNFMVAAAVITDHDGCLLSAVARKIPLLDINAGEAKAALLAIETTADLYPFIQDHFGRRLISYNYGVE